MNDRSKLVINPPDEKVGEVKKQAQTRKAINELDEADMDVELFATIVQVSDIRFYETCPKCFKRARQKENSFFCEEHGEIKPNYSYVLNLVLDDGQGTIRAVFFREQLNHLLELSKEDILGCKDNQEKLEEIKNNILGNQIKVIGKVSKNQMFDRLEFIVNKVFPKPDPKEEIKRLQEK